MYSLTSYSEYSPVSWVQLKYAERFVFCPVLKALVWIKIHDCRLSNNSSAASGNRPVYGQRYTQVGIGCSCGNRTALVAKILKTQVNLKIFKKKNSCLKICCKLGDNVSSRTALLSFVPVGGETTTSRRRLDTNEDCAFRRSRMRNVGGRRTDVPAAAVEALTAGSNRRPEWPS